MLRLKYAFLFLTLVALFTGCLTTAGETADAGVSGDSVEEDALATLDPTIEDPYQFSRPYPFHPPYAPSGDRTADPAAMSPILAVMPYRLTGDRGGLALLTKALEGFTDPGNSGFLTPPRHFEVVPYEKVRRHIRHYLKEGAYIPELPPSQWAAGMFGADAYLEFGFEEKIGKEVTRVEFFSRTVMTGSGQVVRERDERLEISSALSAPVIETRVLDFFRSFYQTEIQGAASGVNALLSDGRFSRLILRNLPASFDGDSFVASFSGYALKVVEQKSEKGVIILDVWSLMTDSEFETAFFRSVKRLLGENRMVDLVSQDRVSFVYEVELLDGYGG